MRKRLSFALVLCTLLVAALAGCKSSASFSQFLGDAKVELTELDGTVEGDFDLPYTNISFDVGLDAGTVDIEIVDVDVIPGDEETDDEIIPLDTIFEAKGLTTGDHKSFTDDDGRFIIRLTSSDGANGLITFSED